MPQGLLLMGWVAIPVVVAISMGRYIGAGNVAAARQAAHARMLAAAVIGAFAVALFFKEKGKRPEPNERGAVSRGFSELLALFNYVTR
jgi:hypothetical protein